MDDYEWRAAFCTAARQLNIGGRNPSLCNAPGCSNKTGNKPYPAGHPYPSVSGREECVTLSLYSQTRRVCREPHITELQLQRWPCQLHYRRPTFLPSMKLKPPRAGWLDKDSRRGMLAAYLNALGDLAGPKRAMPTLRDVPRLVAYSDAMRRILAERPGDNPAPMHGFPAVAPRSIAVPPASGGLMPYLGHQWHLIRCDHCGECPSPARVNVVLHGSLKQSHRQWRRHVPNCRRKSRVAHSGAHALTLAAGGGVLPLLAAAAGAANVTAVERSRMLYRMARQVLCCAVFTPPHLHFRHHEPRTASCVSR
jgi:hypothetical protein